MGSAITASAPASILRRSDAVSGQKRSAKSRAGVSRPGADLLDGLVESERRRLEKGRTTDQLERCARLDGKRAGVA